MNKTRTPQNLISVEATLKRFDEEEVALDEQLHDYFIRKNKLHIKRNQALGRLKKAQTRLL